MGKLTRYFVNVVSACVIVILLSSYGLVTAVVAPGSNAGWEMATVSKSGKAAFSIVDAPVRASAIQFQAAGMNVFTMEQLSTLTPAQYRQITGKRLGFVKSMELRMLQKQLKKQSRADEGGDLPKWVYIVLSIFFLGWLAIGIRSNWKGNDWWIALLLYFLFYLPGLIYSLVVMKKYY